MISFAEKRKIQSTILEQNKILSSNPSFADKRQAQKIKSEAMIKLGLVSTGQQTPNAETEQPDEDQPIERKSIAHLYEFDPNRKPAQRKKDNAAAMALLDRIDSGEIDANSLTDEQKATLAKYSGTGGALIGADGKKGSAYEYYTPKPIAEGVWDLMSELGFSGGKVLDPSAGVGVFGAVAPINAAVDAIELNETSGRINGLVNDGPGYSTTVSAFERVAANTPDESYDAIVTNVPFGGVADRGGNQLLDNRYQKEPLQNYFILRSLEKLKPGGLAVFITPPRCVSGKGGKEEDLRVKASFMSEFLGAYRLPNSVFGTASADTMTDVIAFRKYSRETLDKIAELREQSPQSLIEANVQWQEFIDGHYFDREWKRFILGEFVPKDPNKFRDVDRVINPANVAEIGRMLKRFPDSRINWDLLGAVETSPIIYRDGDTITQSGQTLQMQNGRWVAMARTEESVDMAELAGNMATPYKAFENKVTWSDAIKYFDYMIETSQALDIPAWARGVINEIKRLSDEGDRGKYWNAGVVGMSVAQVLEERLSEEVGVKYVDEYPALSDAMQRVSTIAKGRPSSFGGKIKDGLLAIGNHYQKKTGFSAVWRGDVQQVVTTMEITADSSFEGLRYKTRSAWVTLEDARGIYGDDFDPIGDQAWCVSPDGKSVTRADDYYVGNYAEFLKRVDAEIAAASDDKVRDKLLRQKLDADSRVDRIDVSKLTFNLFTPFVTNEEKAEFLRRFVHPAAVVVFDEKTGEKRVDIDIPGSKLTDREKLINRIGDYLKNGTITLGGAKLDMEKAKALQELRRMVNTANEQFNGWVRGNSVIMRRLEGISSDPTKLRFRQVEDSSPMKIQGVDDSIVVPHGYQYAEIRRQSREFGGINGFGVGLGKTLTALAAVQYAQSIGVKKKTFIVVPNSVLSNWRKESERAYTNQDDLLFVGLRVNKAGKALVNSTNFDADLTAIMENRHSKIFMTMEAFERIRLRDETIAQYEQFLRKVDASFAESEDKKEDERAKSKQAGLVSILSKKTGSAPYLEDLGVDSIVIDEAHIFKNAAQTIDFKSAKFLSLSPASQRGLDAQAKAWFIRGKSSLGDGVLLLTATAITNSPLEIYSMLSLSVGHERVNDMCLGIKGADNFMEVFVQKENQDDVTIDGVARTTDVFVGLNNVSILRKSIGEVATIKSAEDVGEQIVVPDREEKASAVTLTDDIVDRLGVYKRAFRFAIDTLAGKEPNRGGKEAFDAVSAHFGEEMDLIGHPFNLINKMTLLIADPELDQRATFYNFIGAQKDKAQDAVSQFNAKNFTEERPRFTPMSSADSVVSRKVTKDEAGNEVTILKIKVVASIIDGNRIAIDTINPETQSAFEDIAEKIGLDLDVSVPPKLAAMLENFQNEQVTPRGIMDDGSKSPVVKQIIFCDILPLHNKIKRLLNKRAGIPSGAIAIITGKTNNKPDEILAVQDGFNAFGEDNKYRVVIANEKAEVGINLQRGTQAIHHLTIGWTPDSLEQRNGRGVRQGNKTGHVNSYYYDADGTFDTSKRSMVNKKADWIGQVMDVNGSENVAVTGGLSREQMEALIEVVGDADAMKRMQETIAAKEAETRAATNRDKQMINIDTIRKQNVFLNANPSPVNFIADKMFGLWNLEKQMWMLNGRINNPLATESAVARNKALLSDVNSRISSLRNSIERSATITKNTGYNSITRQPYTETVSIDDVFAEIRKKSNRKESEILEMLRGKIYPSFEVSAIEGGPIVNDWQSEVDMANSMIEESKNNFIRQASEHGSYPAEVAKIVAEGGGDVHDGKPVVTGMFVRFKDGAIGIVNVANNTVVTANKSGNFLNYELAATLKDAVEVIYPGSSGYEACLDEAAQIEDKANEDGNIQNAFNSLVPVITQRRKTDVLTEYSTYNYILPQPYFPFVITKAGTEVEKHIFASQSEIIKSSRTGRFTVPSSVAITGKPEGLNNFDALREYAIAHQLKLVIADFTDSEYWLGLQIMKTITADIFRSALTGSTEEEIRNQATNFMLNSVTWFDFEGISPIENRMLPHDLQRVLKEAIKTVTPVPVPVAAASNNTAAPASIVGIKVSSASWADINVWKENIKAAAVVAGDGKYKFDGKTKIWNVLQPTWDHLIANYPGAADKVELVSGTLSYL
ncbi:SNF2-related protein [Nitrosomonas sp.]|uniref:SNF2-related protein n=1 Tax=Nitrosomonas sp. TaxID=42353 RepID=UPI0025DC6756|nr:SNF2-related protein [Nitrosomonas sp.]